MSWTTSLPKISNQLRGPLRAKRGVYKAVMIKVELKAAYPKLL